MSSEMQGTSPSDNDATEPVHVILVNYNRAADTIECLESLLRSDYPNLRIVVVDNCSEDDSVDQLRKWAEGNTLFTPPADVHPELRSLSWPPVNKPVDFAIHSTFDLAGPTPRLLVISNESNEGFAGANNRAIHLILDRGSPGYVCLINNDMVVSGSAIRAMVEIIRRDGRLAAVGAVMLHYNNPSRVQMVGGGALSRLGSSKPFGAGQPRESVSADHPLGYVSGGALLIHTDTIREIGLLDSAFFLYAEDRDWGARMLAAGYRLGYATGAEVWHKGGVTVVPRSPFQDYHVVRAQLQFVRKNNPALLPVAVVHSLLRSVAPKLLRGEWLRLRSIWQAYADTLWSRPVPSHFRAKNSISKPGFGTTPRHS
jgi:GT2 family glycosyltransferase